MTKSMACGIKSIDLNKYMSRIKRNGDVISSTVLTETKSESKANKKTRCYSVC